MYVYIYMCVCVWNSLDWKGSSFSMSHSHDLAKIKRNRRGTLRYVLADNGAPGRGEVFPEIQRFLLVKDGETWWNRGFWTFFLTEIWLFGMQKALCLSLLGFPLRNTHVMHWCWWPLLSLLGSQFCLGRSTLLGWWENFRVTGACSTAIQAVLMLGQHVHVLLPQ